MKSALTFEYFSRVLQTICGFMVSFVLVALCVSLSFEPRFKRFNLIRIFPHFSAKTDLITNKSSFSKMNTKLKRIKENNKKRELLEPVLFLSTKTEGEFCV